ncbi:MAG TPA: hypothetical protein VFJ16_09745 [Longimicrobium sp.]|nr:hypothetical protein [Longimicrobium sp.]
MSNSVVHEKLLEAVVHRAGLDRPFRKQLLAEPGHAIHAAFGVRLPDGFRILFIEKDPSFDAVVLLPDLDDMDEALSDDDLELVAGGGVGDWTEPPPPPPPPPA